MIVETFGRVTLTCDVCLDAQVALDSNDETRRDQLLRQAVDEGWRVGRPAACPECVEAGA